MLLFTQDFQPFSIIEDRVFKAFATALNSEYKLPCRKTISNSFLPVALETEKDHVTKVLSRAEAVTLTTDCWTSRNTESFIGVTAHFIDEDF